MDTRNPLGWGILAVAALAIAFDQFRRGELWFAGVSLLGAIAVLTFMLIGFVRGR
jgi:hypothetical protein